MRKVLVVGGANGVGLSIATEYAQKENVECVYIVDKASLAEEYNHEKFRCYTFDLMSSDYSFFDKFSDIDTLMITAGFGRLALFKDVSEQYIIDSLNVNTLSVLRIIKHFYNKLEKDVNFYCGVMVSIAGFMSSPFFAVYGATKAALKIFIESVNVELIKTGSSNRILNVSPGSLKGTSFTKEKTNLDVIRPMAQEIMKRLEQKDDLFIPQYEEVFSEVLERYHSDFRAEGARSYEYKINSGRMK